MVRKQNIFWLIIIFCGILLFSCKGNLTVKWWSSTSKKQWEEQRNLLLQKIDPNLKFDVEVFPDSLLQEISGFGGSISEKGWLGLSTLPEIKREHILSDLFDPNNSLKLNLCLIPVGADKYALNYYSLDDSINDYSLEYFNIDRDKKTLIPFLKSAIHYQKHLKIWASPSTPPAWMKTNQHYACLSDKNNGLKRTLQGKEGVNQIQTNDTVFLSYAKYFSKYIKDYEKEDISIYGIYVQNEYNSCYSTPSCIWTIHALRNFIGNYLFPQFEKNKINTEVWFGIIDRPFIGDIDSIMAEIIFKKNIKGFGFQKSGKEIIAQSNLRYPEMQLMQIESETGDGLNEWSSAEQLFQLIKYYFNSGVNSYIYGNMIINKLSKTDKFQNSLITIKTDNNVVFNPEFYLIKHFSYFIKPGSHRVIVKGPYSDVLAFVTPNDDLVIITANSSDMPKLLRFKIKNKMIETVLPKNSFNSFLYYNAI